MSRHLHPDPIVAMLTGYQLQMARLALLEAAHSALEPFAISPARVTALSLIRANPGCDQSALARALSINRASAMKLVNQLVERGLVERRPGRDLRSHALHLTATGEAQLPQMTTRMRAAELRVLHPLTEAEQAQLCALLQRLHTDAAPDDACPCPGDDGPSDC